MRTRTHISTIATVTTLLGLAQPAGAGGVGNAIHFNTVGLGTNDAAVLAGQITRFDEHPECLIISATGQPRLYYWRYSGTPSTGFGFPTGWFSTSSKLVAVDFDGDGDDDIAATSPNGPILIENRMTEQYDFIMGDEVEVPGGGGIAAVDVGTFDLPQLGRDGAIFALSDGRVVGHGYAPGATEPWRLAIHEPLIDFKEIEGANLDNQALGDFVTVERQGTLLVLAAWLNFGTPENVSPARLPLTVQLTTATYRDLRIADIDNDGDDDIIVIFDESASLNRVLLFENRMSTGGGFVQRQLGSSHRINIELADVDGDGDDDIICVPHAPEVRFWLENRLEFGEVAFTQQYIPYNGGAARFTVMDNGDDLGLYFVSHAPTSVTHLNYQVVPEARIPATQQNYTILDAALDHAQPGQLIVSQGAEFSYQSVVFPTEKPNLTIRARGPINQDPMQTIVFWSDGAVEVAGENEMNLPGLVRLQADVTARLSAKKINFNAQSSHLRLTAGSECIIDAETAILGGTTSVESDVRLTFTGDVDLGVVTPDGPFGAINMGPGAFVSAAGDVTLQKTLNMFSLSEFHAPHLTGRADMYLQDARIFADVLLDETMNARDGSQIFGDLENDGVINVTNGRLIVHGDYTGAGAVRLRVPLAGAVTSVYFGGRFAPSLFGTFSSVHPDSEFIFGGDADFQHLNPAAFDLKNYTLRAGGDSIQDFECMSDDLGATNTPFEVPIANVFPLHCLIVGPAPLANGSPAPAATRLVLVDNHDNARDGQDVPEAIYVDTLILQSNGEIRTEGHTIYCREFINHGGIIDDPSRIVVIPASCAADYDGDGSVTSADLATLLGAWGPDSPADVTGDGAVTAEDLAVVLGSWGPCQGS